VSAVRQAYVGLEANVGPSRDTLAMAIGRLGALGRVTRVSSLWRTAPRDRTDQPTFLNAVAAIENERWIADPEALLAELKGIERACGRVDRGRYGPRELDLDISKRRDERHSDPAGRKARRGVFSRRPKGDPLPVRSAAASAAAVRGASPHACTF
jgi:2-amino-4-hydroxy-6-hydroxymethyldihydropteridine diphosphokinase